MISVRDFGRMVQPLKNKIQLIIGRALLTAVNNSGKGQTVSLTLLAGETATDVERFQEYGFDSHPIPGAEAVAAFIGGNRDHGIVVKVHDRRYRKTGLNEGEVCIYTSEDADGDGCSIWLKQGHGIEIRCTDATLTAGGTIDIEGKEVNITGETSVNIDAPTVNLGVPTGMGCARYIDMVVNIPPYRIHEASTKVLVD